MSQRDRDEFYVGYLPQAPDRLGAWLRNRLLLLFLLLPILAWVLVAAQSPLAKAVFEFQNYRDFEGVLLERPYPMLRVDRPGKYRDEPSHSYYYLVQFGKFGGQSAVKGLEGSRVRLRAALIYRDNQTMLELQDESVEVLSDAEAPRPLVMGGGESLGETTLQGEIVDSKCFFGVMNPGNLKPHKACATRCISGGIPPVLVVRNETQAARYFLLTSRDGGMVNRQVLDWVAEPVAVEGEVLRFQDLYVLRINPGAIRPL